MSDKKFMYYAGNRFDQTMEQAKHLAKLATELGGVDIRVYPVGDIRELKEENTKLRLQVNLMRDGLYNSCQCIERPGVTTTCIACRALAKVEELDNG